jgi:subtilase family serine protease
LFAQFQVIIAARNFSYFGASMSKMRVVQTLAVAIGISGSSLGFGAVSGIDVPTPPHNTPRFTAAAKNLGPVDPSSVIEVSIWLNLHNKADLDIAAKDLYDKTSPNYRHWLTKSEFVSKYAPTAGEAKTVSEFFTSNGLKIVSVGPDNFYVRARGTVAQVNSAFHVSLSKYSLNGKTVRSNGNDPFISGPAAPLAAAVAGLDDVEYTHPLVSRTSNLPAPKTTTSTPAVTPGPSDPVFTTDCFPEASRKQTLTTLGGLPTATYKGTGYTNSTTGCGYTPANIQAAYGLTDLYKEGFDGTGQTIVIVDWCGSPTITADANAFSAQFGLPALTPANFNIIYTPTPSYCAAPDAEINLDVEWAHTIAPGASIDLVVPPSATFQDTNQAVFYAANYQLGNVISNSYGAEEYYLSPSTLETMDLINEFASVLGISVNFSTGDEGDFTFDFPEFYPASVSAPASSPWATGVGGTSLSLHADNSIKWQSGWGTNINPLQSGGYVTDPPAGSGFFEYGSGGGASYFFAKPYYQSKIQSATTRQLPDISWVADPFTGAYIAISEPFVTPSLQYTVIGGTSLACPMFSALWAIANQEAGVALGQAAPYLYHLPASAVTDIVPVNPGNNVTGFVEDSAGKTWYHASELAQPLEGTTTFGSALWNYPLNDGTVYLLTFGTDSGLVVTQGWDNVTGVGVPTGKGFADYFAPTTP